MKNPLHTAMLAVKHVEKNSQAMGYKYRGIEAIVQAARPALAAAGLSCRPVEMEILERETRESARGAALIYSVVKVTFCYEDGESNKYHVTTIGEAFDSGDKGITKAISVAQRTAHILALQIPTGEDTESGEQHELSAPKPTLRENPPVAAAEGADTLIDRLLGCASQAEMAALAPELKSLEGAELATARAIYEEMLDKVPA